MTFIEQASAESDAIVDRIKPLLAGRHPALQGIVVSELLAIWLAGHPAEVQNDLIEAHLTATRDLVAIWRPRLGT